MGVSSVQNHEQEDENETTSWSETENCTGKYTITSRMTRIRWITLMTPDGTIWIIEGKSSLYFI
jgi:hypothetical protein